MKTISISVNVSVTIQVFLIQLLFDQCSLKVYVVTIQIPVSKHFNMFVHNYYQYLLQKINTISAVNKAR